MMAPPVTLVTVKFAANWYPVMTIWDETVLTVYVPIPPVVPLTWLAIVDSVGMPLP